MADKSLNSLLSDLRKLSPYSSCLEEGGISDVTKWISTGCLPFNAILSGSLYGGIPKNRITVFSGDSGCGKTFIINKIIANAQKEHDMFAFFIDTEAALDKESAKRLGVDTANVEYNLSTTIEDCKIYIMKIIKKVEENPELKGRFIIAIDSLGGLNSKKEISDTEVGKSAADMGLRAKELKSMLRQITGLASANEVTIIASNHVYCDPSQLHPSIFKKSAGGKGPEYMSTLGVQMAAVPRKTDDKDDADEAIKESKTYSGVTLRMLTVKNRLIPQFLACEVYLNFKNGLDPYAGLKDMAVNHGVIQQTGSTFTMGDRKLGYFKSFRRDEDLWKEILKELEVKILEEYRFGNPLDKPAVPEIVEEE